MILIQVMYFISITVYLKLCNAEIGKSSVTFVIDDTRSMGEDIEQVKYGVTKIFETVTSCNDSFVEDFILITFNDHMNYGHKPRLLTKTLDEETFQEKLSEIEVSGGGDCPEMSLSGIELGLKESQPGSYIYVFTDAMAKDNWLVDKIQNLAIKKRSQIVFIMTNGPVSCEYKLDDPQYLVYQQLADATSGLVFHMVKNDVGAILAYVTQTMEKRKEQIIRRSFPPGYGHKFEIKVDGAMRGMLIAESGHEPQIGLVSTNGSKVDFESIVDIQDAKVVKIFDLKPGDYIAEVGSTSGSTVVVTAESSVIFNYGFSAGTEPTSCTDDETPTMPVAGVDSYLVIQLITEDEVNLDSVQLIGIDGSEKMKIPLKLINEEQKLYVTVKDFKPPDGLFKIAINGLHVDSNTNLTRMSRTAIEVQKVLDKIEEMSLKMNIDKGNDIKLKYNEPLKLACKVKGYPKPEITWVDETGTILTTEVVTVNIPYDHRSLLEMENVTNNKTFKCQAKNANGDISQVVKVEVKSSYFNRVDKPNDTSIEFMKSGKVSCKVNALPVANITWKINDVVIQNNDDFEILDDSNVLYVKKMLPHMVGKYGCLANNEIESVLMPFELKILKTAPEISIDGPSKVDAEYNEPLSLYCRAVGYPEVKLAWFDDTTGEELSSIAIPTEPNSYNYGRKLLIERVDRNSVYKCKASNTVGEVTATVTVETLSYFKVIEYPKDTTIEYMKDGKVVCKADAKPTAEIGWLFEGNPMETNAHYTISADNTTLSFTNMQPSMAGYYTCVVSNENNFTSFNFYVGISGLVGPVIDKTNDTVNVLEGSAARIDCIVLQGIPAPTITWMFKVDDEERFVPMDETTNFIQFENAQRDQTGYYRCIAENPHSRDSHTVYLSVEFPPTIEVTESRIKAEDGNEITLPCRTSGVPEPQVTWILNDLLIVSRKEDTIFRDHSLRFKASPSKSGPYTCTASNIHGAKNMTIQVDYFVPVAFEIPEETTIVKEVGEDVSLPCEVDGYPPPSIKWLFFSTDCDGKVARVLRKAVSPDTFVLRNVQIDQDGDYTCVATNGPSEKNMTYSVHINGKPKIIDSTPSTINAVAGDLIVSVPCKAIGRPKPDITWVNEKGFKIAAGTEWNDIDENGSLIFKNIDVGGFVTCVVENQYGSDRKTYRVVVDKYASPTSPVSDQRVKLGEPAEINCPLPHTKVDSVRWYIDDRLIATEDQKLKFAKVASHDKGLYTCRVSSLTSPAKSAKIQLTPIE